MDSFLLLKPTFNFAFAVSQSRNSSSSSLSVSLPPCKASRSDRDRQLIPISSSPQTPQSDTSRHLIRVLAGACRGIRLFLFPSAEDVSGGRCMHELQQNGAIGIALLSLTVNATVRISPIVTALAANPTFVSGLLAWLIAQSSRAALNYYFLALVEKRKRYYWRWSWRLLFGCGGMPCSHSAMCAALTTSVAMCRGMADSFFPVCLGFSLIVMYDAIGVKRHAGMQAKVANMIVEDLFEGRPGPGPSQRRPHPLTKRKLKELVGHTPSQVLAGALLGTLVAFSCHRPRL